jgi:hypothetical protein
LLCLKNRHAFTLRCLLIGHLLFKYTKLGLLRLRYRLSLSR